MSVLVSPSYLREIEFPSSRDLSFHKQFHGGQPPGHVPPSERPFTTFIQAVPLRYTLSYDS
ncbi:hypothetical protein DM02DRAFT_436206 [Periconia macrospinosa]|uniref:Uncharacterized protein n=1 Tax=Periconia macrospinosa TaxID=97972 RepID=A0A2V1CXQ1_9PLEO|nr:hypothetical protein DM02DRAFT_436206 [Periconia macrospinosa]